MLERLYVKNIALIDEAEIEFDGRLNVLSGETGSGKSVLLDSINFVLGSKADKGMIRYGTDEAVVRAEFTIPDDGAAAKVLEEFDIDCDGSVLISRKFTDGGKGAIKVNGVPVTAAMLKKIAAHLVDVHGQSEHFFLLSEANQLTVVDSLCGEKLSVLKSELSALLAEKRDLIKRISELGGSERERAQKLDILSYQINEIKNAGLKVGELETLKAKKRLIDNAEKVIGALNSIKQILNSDDGCNDLLSSACRQAANISDVGEEYEKIYERLENLAVETEDVSQTISDLAENFFFDEREAQETDERLTLIKSLIKKYGSDEESVLSFLSEAERQYDALNDAAETLEKINLQIKKIDGEIFEVCLKMTEARKEKCKLFCAEVEEQLKSLNIPNAKFSVEFTEYSQGDAEVTANGADKICFMFSANRGEPPKPLSKVISGGEMSRFMLAIKTRLKDLNGISTYIFDEIDAGISGVTAKSVADKFISISRDTQIIAVSHLPQVCAAASAQYLISKSDTADGKTITSVERLSRGRRVEELVRLTGSISTDAAKAHAEELLKQFNN